MLSLPKLALVSLVLVSVGALQFAQPAFTGSQSLVANTDAIQKNNDLLATQLANQVVSEYPEPQSGTLYLHSQQREEQELAPHRSVGPLLKSKVDMTVTGIVARTTVTQTFKNASENWVDGMYVFPLPENAAVDHLLMTIGERKIEGQIKEKSIANKLFKQAKSAGKKASLVAQHRPNVFSNKIANIGPGEKIEVRIEYQQTLTLNDQHYSLRFPMIVAPRYTPARAIHNTPIPSSDAQSSFNPDIQLSAKLQPGFDLQNIHSEFHPISKTRIAGGGYAINLKDNGKTDQDFVLTWQPELGSAPKAARFTQLVNGDEYGLLMLHGPKNNDLVSATPKEVIYVLDTSGSMEGESIVQAKQALLLAIEGLSEDDSFNLIEFNSHAQNLWRTPQQATTTNKEQAREFVGALDANGGTEMQSALNLAFLQTNRTQQINKSAMRQIIFITDGSVSNEEALMQLIQSNIKDSRLFTVGIGSAPNSYFMTEAAKVGKGTFTYIGSTDQVQQKMAALLTKLQHPVLTDIELVVDKTASLESEENKLSQKLEIYPNVISDLYLGEPLILSYKLSQATSTDNDALGEITLIGKLQGKNWRYTLPSEPATRQSGLNVLWAREKISQLTRDKRRARIHSSQQDIQDEYRSQITQTALEHHLVSQYTSLIAIDTTPALADELRAKESRKMLAKGTSNNTVKAVGQLPQTATPAQLKIFIGLFLIGLTICMRLLTRSRLIFQSYFH